MLLQQPTTDSFTRWFGGSRIVDKAGRPLALYHGTAARFDAFCRRHAQTDVLRTNGLGHFFTPSREFAERYAGYKAGATVLAVYLALPEPLELEFADLQGAIANPRALARLSARIGSAGAIVYRDGRQYEFIASDAAQIKRATDNSGAYNPTDPCIYR